MRSFTIDKFFDMVEGLNNVSPITNDRMRSSTGIQYSYYHGITLNIGLNLTECASSEGKLTGPVLVKLVFAGAIVGEELDYLRDIVEFSMLAEQIFSENIFTYQP
jgi:hypothetical protein